MGWFAVAAVFGFLLFWTWRNFLRVEAAVARNWLAAVFGPGLPVVAAALLTAILLLWAWSAADGSGLQQIIDVIGRGTVARGLLGIVVGFGLGYAIEHRILVASPPQASTKGNDGKGGARSGGTSALLTVGFGAVILALTAPHLDNWLSHLTTLKSPLIELQLGSVASHKVSVTEGTVELNDSDSLKNLASYNSALRKDIDFAESYGGRNAELKSVKELQPAFEYLISPIAACVQIAINNGLSTDSARQIVRPMMDELAQIVFHEGNDDQDVAAQHDKFWSQLEGIPSRIQNFLKSNKTKCLAFPQQYRDCLKNPQGNEKICLEYSQKNPGNEITYPKFSDYRNVPYLNVAASHLFSFMTDDDSALRVLHNTEQSVGPNGKKLLKFKDYSFLQSAGQLSYYLGKPGDLRESYFGYLNDMNDDASQRVAILQMALESCPDLICKSRVNGFLQRHWAAKMIAINHLTYYLAEDLARDSIYALPYVARTEELAVWLENAVTEGIKHEAQNKYYAVGEGAIYYIMDTFAYAKLVLEARKTNPDVEKFKKLKNEFKRVVEHVEYDASKTKNIRKIDLTLVKIARAHYASARELAGE